MKGKFTTILMSLALLALVLPSTGCDKRIGGYGYSDDWSFTDVFLGFDYVPSFDDSYYEEYEEYEYTEYYEEEEYYEEYDFYDGYDCPFGDC